MLVNVRPQSLQELRRMLDEIYGKHNLELYSTHDIQNQVWEQKSKVAKRVRKEDWEGLVVQLAVLSGWLMALWERIGLDIEEAVWFKYPNICPACFKSAGCSCIGEGLKYNPEDSRLNRFRRDTRNMPKSMPEWQATSKRIYGNINRIMTAEKTWLHLDEELGEMSIELRHRNPDEITNKLKEESGDVFFWLLGFANRLAVDLDEAIWQTYPGECNVCRQEKCVCPYD